MPQGVHGTFLSMSKIEVGADAYGANMQPFDQKLAHEVICGESGEVAIESDCKQQVDTALLNLFDLPFRSADAFRRFVRIEHLDGVRLKRQGNGRQRQVTRFPDNCCENCLVTQVETVKVSDAQNARSACQDVCSCRQ
jgi:hypothetical protein